MLLGDTYHFVGHLFSEQPLATCSKDLNDREGRSGSPTPVPTQETKDGVRLYFPATGIRQKFRTSCLNLIRDLQIKKTNSPTPFSLDEHYLLSKGGIKGGAVDNKAGVAEEGVWREKNPLLSLFGAGNAGMLGWMEGHAGVGNAICENPVEAQIFSGARADEFYRSKHLVKYLSREDVEDLVSRASGNSVAAKIKAEIKKLEKELKDVKLGKSATPQDEVEARIKEQKDRLASIKESSGTDDVSVGMPLAGFKAIPMGQKLAHTMIITRTNLSELGLFLKSFEYFAADPFIGAHRATGCGMVSGEWEVYKVGIGVRELVGTVSFQALHPVEYQGEGLHAAISAFNRWVESGVADFSIPHEKGA